MSAADAARLPDKGLSGAFARGWKAGKPGQKDPGVGFAHVKPPDSDRYSRLRRKRMTLWERIRHGVVIALAVIVGVPGATTVGYYLAADIPRPTETREKQIANILAADGKTVLSQIVPPEGNRTRVKLAEVPLDVRNAVLAAEDRHFYSNPGFSVGGFMRAAWANLRGAEEAGGGSTITQQYVKNAFLTSERSLIRKMKELVIATKMAREWSKDDILEAYLNTIYFGRGAYGIASASSAYFGKAPAQLTLGEGAVLAALIRTPTALGPDTHPTELRNRWDYVLDAMVDMKSITAEVRKQTPFPVFTPNRGYVDAAARNTQGLIRTQVLRELAAAKIDDARVNTGGLRITTTIDTRAQAAAENAVTRSLGPQPPQLRSAVVSIDPRSGAVRAYYGGNNGTGFDYAQALVQPGSAFKVFGVVAALRNGIPLGRTYSSDPVADVRNSDGESCGRCSIAEGLKRSLNTVMYRMLQDIPAGPGQVATAARDAGIPAELPGLRGPSLTDDGQPPNNGIVLGQYVVRPLDMAAAYATLAASGVRHEPYFVQRVVDSNGKVLLDRGPGTEGEQRISQSVADNVTRAMLPIAAYSRGHALAGGRPSAAKTGTTGLTLADNKDAWMVGFTPSLSTAVWVGTERPAPIRTAAGADIYGAGLPADIWKAAMDGALAGSPHEALPARQGGSGNRAGPSSVAPEIIIPPPGPPPPLIPG